MRNADLPVEALAVALVFRTLNRWRIGAELVSTLRAGFAYRVIGYVVVGRMDWRQP